MNIQEIVAAVLQLKEVIFGIGLLWMLYHTYTKYIPDREKAADERTRAEREQNQQIFTNMQTCIDKFSETMEDFKTTMHLGLSELRAAVTSLGLSRPGSRTPSERDQE